LEEAPNQIHQGVSYATEAKEVYVKEDKGPKKRLKTIE
jgi:hypothetical protein